MVAERFWDWGIPTALSTIEVVENTGLTVISTGGVRSGADVAKALALGASAGGMALPLLGAAMKSPDAVIEVLNRVIEELKIAMFLMGAEDVKGLRECDLIITGKTREWLQARGIDYKKYASRKDL